jgi:amino acid transporter
MTTDVGAFTRQSTGLTREAGTASTLIYNINFISIGLMMMFAIQLIPAFYPGGNMIASYVLALIIVLPTSLAFALLSAAMPRSGGDYVFVSRILGPRAGMTSSWINTIWWFIYGGVPSAFLARYALGPLFRSLGLMTGNPTLIELGEWFVTPAGTIITGTILIAVLVFLFARGLGVYFRFQNVLFGLAVVGLVVAAVILVSGSADAFTTNFNSYWNPETGQADTHQAMIDAAAAGGFVEAPADFYWMLIPITWIYLELVFCQSSSYIGGEVRQASRVQIWSMPVAAIISIGVAIVLTLLLQNVIGVTFLGAVGWDPFLADTSVLGLPFAMPFSELVAYLSASPIVALLLGLGFVFWSYTWLPGQILNASRNLLAYGLDGVLPARLATVSERYHTPVVALVLTGALSVVALVVYATNPDFTTLVGIVAFIVSFMFVSVSAIMLPYRRRELFESSPINWRIGGLPVVTIVGVLSLIACLVAEWCYLSDPLSGVGVLANGFFGEDGAPTKDFARLLIAAGTVVSGFVVYEISRWYRGRQGVRLEQAFAEIPVE